MDIEQRIYDADQARQVLENDAFKQAFADMRQEVIEQWTQSPARDVEGREKLYQYLRMMDKLQACLTSRLETGKLAKLELQHKQTLAEQAKGWLGMT